MTEDWVELEPFRKAVKESGLNFNEIAQKMGQKSGEGSYVRRLLGEIPYYASGRRYPPKLSTRMRYETAVKLCQALGRDPIDFGI